mmetsp:Transcript_1262/g.3423  ORF Transcript_1262/g.3423 Transcript_1262/m.3423 type:complete len:384 (+) Transcript_1262:883-2034(+)
MMHDRIRPSRSWNATWSLKSRCSNSRRKPCRLCPTCPLLGCASTASKVQNGSATCAGRLIQSGNRPRSSCKFRDLPPTIEPSNSGEGTAYRPMNSRLAMLTPEGGADMDKFTAPEPGAAPSEDGSTGVIRRSSAPTGAQFTAWPCIPSSSAMRPASNTVAKRTRSFLARTDVCARTSGMSGVMRPTTPGGISSSPPTLRDMSTVGIWYVLFWTSLRSLMTSMTPAASTGEMMDHEPMLDISRSRGSNARSICERGAAGVPRTTSSEKMSRTWPSTPSLPPMACAVGWSALMYRCETSPRALFTRSTTDLAWSAQSFPPLMALLTTPCHCCKQMTSSSLPPEDSARFSSVRPVILRTSTGARVAMEERFASTTCRTADSSARSR